MLGQEKKSKFIRMAEVLPANKFTTKLLAEREAQRLQEEEMQRLVSAAHANQLQIQRITVDLLMIVGARETK